MILVTLTLLLKCLLGLTSARHFDISSDALESGNTPTKIITADLFLIQNKLKINQIEKVEIKLYYESLCPGCREFVTESLVPTVEKLSQYLNIQLYPYGNAETRKTDDGHYLFHCQHGPAECYGNKLDACAIDILKNITEAVFFNGCMMTSNQTGRGSNDLAADACAKSMEIDSSVIKQCAKGEKGVELLNYYGEESKKVNFNYVPYILVNGEVNNGDNFMKDVCSAFTNPPPPCSSE